MRIVNVEDYFIPDAGYQINVLSKYLQAFGHDVIIVTADVRHFSDTTSSFFGNDNLEVRDAEFTQKTGVKVIRVRPLINKFISGRIFFGTELKKTVLGLKPDLVYVHGNDTLTGIQYLWKKQPFSLVTDSHMLRMASTNRFSKYFQKFYRAFITPKILKRKIPVIRTQDDDYVEACLGIPLTQAPWISYGTDVALFHPNSEVKKAFRQKHEISDEDFVFIYTGKLDEAKGGELLATTFLKSFSTSRNVVLIVVGNTCGEYGEKVEQLFAQSENKILRFPTQKYYDLGQFYQAADVCVFAKQCSLSFYDAQGCGLPVLSEDNNINIDRNSHGNGWTFKSGDFEDFRKKIEQIANMSKEEFGPFADNAYKFIAENYNYEAKAREYEKVLKHIHREYRNAKKDHTGELNG